MVKIVAHCHWGIQLYRNDKGPSLIFRQLSHAFSQYTYVQCDFAEKSEISMDRKRKWAENWSVRWLSNSGTRIWVIYNRSDCNNRQINPQTARQRWCRESISSATWKTTTYSGSSAKNCDRGRDESRRHWRTWGTRRRRRNLGRSWVAATQLSQTFGATRNLPLSLCSFTPGRNM